MSGTPFLEIGERDVHTPLSADVGGFFGVGRWSDGRRGGGGRGRGAFFREDNAIGRREDSVGISKAAGVASGFVEGVHVELGLLQSFAVMDDRRLNEDQQLGAVLILAFRSEKRADHRKAVKDGNAAASVCGGLGDESTKDDGFVIGDSNGGDQFALENVWNEVGVIVGTDLPIGADVVARERDLEGHFFVGVDQRDDLKLEGDVFVFVVRAGGGGSAAGVAVGRNGDLGAADDRSFLVVGGEDRGPGKDLEIRIVLHGIEVDMKIVADLTIDRKAGSG